jgi:hypothetical protein
MASTDVFIGVAPDGRGVLALSREDAQRALGGGDVAVARFNLMALSRANLFGSKRLHVRFTMERSGRAVTVWGPTW